MGMLMLPWRDRWKCR